MMRVFLGEADRWQGEPTYQAIVKRLRMMEVSGATVYRGILGYGAKGHKRKDSFFHISRDLPIMISVIDSAEKLAEAQPVIESMMEDGLIVFSDIEAVRLVQSSEAADAKG
jgi:PII-like signaling protein